MTRFRTVMVALVVCCFSAGAWAASPAQQLHGTWRAMAAVTEDGQERTLPNRPNDNPRMSVRLIFDKDQTFKAVARSAYDKNAPSPMPPLPDDAAQKLNFVQESSGIWSLSGNQLTMETKRPEPLDPFKTDIQLKGDSLVVVIAGMGRLRLERVR